MNKVTDRNDKSSGTQVRLLPEPASPAEQSAAVAEFFAGLAKIHSEKRAVADTAFAALERLGDAMAQKTGQSYYLRELLFSLWNGKPAAVINILELDWSLRKDLCAVLMAFGYESLDATQSFFYRTIEDAMKKRGLLAWFLEQGDKEVAA